MKSPDHPALYSTDVYKMRLYYWRRDRILWEGGVVDGGHCNVILQDLGGSLYYHGTLYGTGDERSLGPCAGEDQEERYFAVSFWDDGKTANTLCARPDRISRILLRVK